MVSQTDLVRYLDQLLGVQKIQDDCPNGLQVSGKPSIKNIVTGVTACKALLEQAVGMEADAVLVHHGYFWKKEPLPLTGIKYERLRILLTHQINLFAYHLPLDVHAVYGNNAQLAKVLDIQVKGQSVIEELPLMFYGELPLATMPEAFSLHIEKGLKRKPLYIPGGRNAPIQRVAWCTGAAQQFVEWAHQLGVDAYLTGEISEATPHAARELGIDFFACGHHATERYGIQALGEHLAQQFQIKHTFVDIENPA